MHAPTPTPPATPRRPLRQAASIVAFIALAILFNDFRFTCRSVKEEPPRSAATAGPGAAPVEADGGQGAGTAAPGGQVEGGADTASDAPDDAAAAAEEVPAAPPFPGLEAGPVAWWRWLVANQADYTIEDTAFRLMFGAISIPILLLFESVAVRQGIWFLYLFLIPFWLIFGSISLGPVLGLQALGAHLIGFPVARAFLAARGRGRGAPPRPGAPSRPADDGPMLPPPLPEQPGRPSHEEGRATPAAQAPGASHPAFRPDLSRFRRRP